MPIWRINKSGEYDIQTGGHAVAPPSLHRSGRRYTWLQAFPDSLEKLPFAPEWVLGLITTAANNRQARHVLTATGGKSTPTLPDHYAVKWWNGETVKRKPDGEIDRSATLWAIGGQLARGGTTQVCIAEALAERDIALGFGKYTDRPEEYQRIAEKVITDRAIHTLRPVPMAPMRC